MDEISIPAIFMISHDDKVSLPQKVEKMYKKYKGEKKLRYFRGEHHDAREYDIIKDGVEFLRTIEKKRLKEKKKKNLIFIFLANQLQFLKLKLKSLITKFLGKMFMMKMLIFTTLLLEFKDRIENFLAGKLIKKN